MPAEPAKPAAAPAADKKKVVPKDLIKRLASGENIAEPTPASKAAPAPAAPAAAPAAEPAAAAPAAAEPPRVRKVKKDEVPELPKAPPAAAASVLTPQQIRDAVAEGRQASGAPAAVPAIKPDDQRDLDLATFAAGTHADRYADLPGKLKDWFVKRDEFLAKKATELGGRESAEFRDYVSGQEFRAYASEHAPKYQRGDSTKIYEEFLEERGARRAMERMKPELEAVKLTQREMQERPIIDNVVSQCVKIMLTDPDPVKDPGLDEFLRTPTEFVQNNEVEGGIIVREANFFRAAMDEMMKIGSGLVDVRSSQNPTQTQQWLDGYIQKTEKEMKARYPNGVKMPDGKILVTTDQYQEMADRREPRIGEYRRIYPAEIAGAIAVEGRMTIKRKLAEERQRLERSGYARRGPAAAAPAPAPDNRRPAAPASPMASSSPARGAAAGTPPAKPEHWSKKYTQG